jgi:hypothetical protein
MGRVFYVIDNGQECADVHAGAAAGGAHSLVAEAELYTEAADYL